MRTLTTTTISKLGSKILCFNLPVTSCRGATAECAKYCYAKKGRFKFNNVKSAYQLNMEATKKNSFVEIINAEIKLHLANGGSPLMRIHSSGDFWSPAYYEKWVQIAKLNPSISFLAFTRIHKIDFEGAPSNLHLIFSTDKSTKRFPTQETRKAFVIEKGEAIPGSAHLCNSKCSTCHYCWESKGDVCFVRR